MLEKALKQTNEFDAPQMIGRETKTYGLERSEAGKIIYWELEKGKDTKWKRTDRSLETTPKELSREIKDKQTKVIVPSKSFISQQNDKQYAENFRAPQMIERGAKTYGFEKREAGKILYRELEKGENTKWKRTDRSLETTPKELAREIKNKQTKVIVPDRETQLSNEIKRKQNK